MNEVVKYHNCMNSLKFTNFTAVDFNFLMALCSRMKNQDINKLVFSFEELRKITGYTRTSLKVFANDIMKMNEKLMKMNCRLEQDDEIIQFVLFPTFATNIKKQTLTVAVNEQFTFILNELIKNFTRFDLSEFVKLDSKYSKTLYRLLKQFKTTGKFEVTLNDFKAKIDCPKAYNNKQLMQNIINPSLKELQNYFTDLQCTVQYAHKRGNPVEGYIFTFKPEKISKSELPAAADKPSKPRAKKGISQEEKETLYQEFGEEIVEDYIGRTTDYHCCSYATIKKWIAEDQEKHKRKDTNVNKFNNFPQRDYGSDGMSELERQLLENE